MTETKTKAPSGRPTRKPVGIRNRLEVVNQDPDRVYRIISSAPSRIQQFVDGGWRIEKANEHILGGQRLDVASPTDNTISVGLGEKHVLVSIEKELYDEDQKAKWAKVDGTEAALKKPDGFYGNVQITQGHQIP